MNEPKYKAGDFVYWRQQVESWRSTVLPLLEKSRGKGYISMGELDLHMAGRPSYFQVLESLVQRCYGGVQIHYLVRKGDGTTFQLTEPELTQESLEPAT